MTFTPSAVVHPGPRGFRALLELFKLRMTSHILITTVVGFYMASPLEFQWALLGWTLLGTGLLAISAFCFNQSMEVKFDRVMERTQNRPLPSDRLGVKAGYAAGIVTCFLGAALLYAQVNTLTALLGILTVVMYAAVYTPLKRLTTFNTLVGGIPGALPPLMGWTAAQNHVGMGGMLLFTLLFFWQLPHFLALAWMYKDDYRRGGFQMLSLVDASGETCFRQVWIQSWLLGVVSVFPYLYGLAGEIYLAVALVSIAVMLWLAYRLRRTGTRQAAVHVFLWSLAYLPLVLIAMALDRRLVFVG
ncbi:MAG: protoheme farnesyltransferase [Fibrobacteria bacterium]|jgi:protoheme IX farnesyltransferase|nr:protoheme farnesyltransferase [Fibrobacteria bacterium]